MLVILILVAVALGPVWGRRLDGAIAYGATVIGWVLAMLIVLGGAAVTQTKSDAPDLGFFVFNSILLIVGLGLTRLASQSRQRRAITG